MSILKFYKYSFVLNLNQLIFLLSADLIDELIIFHLASWLKFLGKA